MANVNSRLHFVSRIAEIVVADHGERQEVRTNRIGPRDINAIDKSTLKHIPYSSIPHTFTADNLDEYQGKRFWIDMTK